jgi:hypothetical protein
MQFRALYVAVVRSIDPNQELSCRKIIVRAVSTAEMIEVVSKIDRSIRKGKR